MTGLPEQTIKVFEPEAIIIFISRSTSSGLLYPKLLRGLLLKPIKGIASEAG